MDDSTLLTLGLVGIAAVGGYFFVVKPVMDTLGGIGKAFSDIPGALAGLSGISYTPSAAIPSTYNFVSNLYGSQGTTNVDKGNSSNYTAPGISDTSTGNAAGVTGGIAPTDVTRDIVNGSLSSYGVTIGKSGFASPNFASASSSSKSVSIPSAFPTTTLGGSANPFVATSLPSTTLGGSVNPFAPKTITPVQQVASNSLAAQKIAIGQVSSISKGFFGGK